MKEGYPDNWVRGTLIGNPETNEIHALDGERDEEGRYKLYEIVKKLQSGASAGAKLKVALERVAKLESMCDELYSALRAAEVEGLENGDFCEGEEASGPNGYYPDLEKRWVAQNSLLCPPEFDRTKTKEG